MYRYTQETATFLALQNFKKTLSTFGIIVEEELSDV